MSYKEFEALISYPRLHRYNSACKGQLQKTRELYYGNIRLSKALLGVLSIFEIVLRNKIDRHYKNKFNTNPDWLLASITPGGFLSSTSCQNSRKKITEAHQKLGANYTHDKLLAELTFGFWKFLFAGSQFQAGGNTLLQIFPLRPSRCNQKTIYQKLDKINSIRNRVAHHEPICFNTTNVISSAYALFHYQQIIDLITYMGIDAQLLFSEVDDVIMETRHINRLTT